MAECITLNDIDKSTAGANNANISRDDASVTSRITTPLADRLADVDSARVQRVLEEVNRHLGDGTELVADPSPGEMELARQAATSALELTARSAERTRQQDREQMDRLRAMAAGSTVGNATWWSNLTNRVYTNFVFDRGALNQWLGIFGKMPGVNEAYRNQFVRLFESVNPKVRGFHNKLMQRIEDLVDWCQPIANRNGFSPRDVATLLGHYAIAKHMPERNQELLRRWGVELRDLAERCAIAEMRGATDAPDYISDVHAATALAEKIHRLEQNLELTNAQMDPTEAENLWSGGYTNGEARAIMQRIINKLDISQAEADEFARKVSGEYQYYLDERARNGTLDAATVRSFPGFRDYVAVMSRRDGEVGNSTGSPTDATPYNPGSYHEIKGTRVAPESAFTSLIEYARKASVEIGTKEFGFALNELYNHLARTGELHNSGLKRDPYANIMKEFAHNPDLARMADTVYNQGGLVAMVPNKNGQMEKVFFHFDPRVFRSEHGAFDGAMLNKALSSDFKLEAPGPIINTLARGTSLLGMLPTRYSPLFSPMAGMKDYSERMFNMFNRTYYDQEGNAIKGSSIAGDMLGNLPTAAHLMFKGMRGELEPGSQEARWWAEFNDRGLNQKFIQHGYVTDRTGLQPGDSLTMENLMNRMGYRGKTLQRLINGAGANKEALMRTLDNWNDSFQNITGWDHFLTLRKRGVSVSDAAADVLEMMNLSQRGRLGPWLQALAPFVNPTVQSGAAMFRTLGFGSDNPKDILKNGAKGYAAILGAALAYSILQPFARDSMGVDENGNSRYDALSFDDKVRYLPIGLGGDSYVKLGIGFGLPQAATAIAVAADMISQGRLSPADAVFNTCFMVFKNAAPGSWPQYQFTDKPLSYAMTMVTPGVFRPLAEAATNTGYFGEAIAREGSMSDATARSDRGLRSTPRIYHRGAKWLNQTWGIDIEPEMFEHFAYGYGQGFLKAGTRLAESFDTIYKGSDQPSALRSLDPILAGLGATIFYGKVPNATRNVFYEARNHYEAMLRRRNVQMTSTSYGDDAAGNERFKRQAMAAAGFDQSEIDDYINIWKAEQNMLKNGREFGKVWNDKWKTNDSSEDLRIAFKELSARDNKFMADVVRNLTYGRL